MENNLILFIMLSTYCGNTTTIQLIATIPIVQSLFLENEWCLPPDFHHLYHGKTICLCDNNGLKFLLLILNKKCVLHGVFSFI